MNNNNLPTGVSLPAQLKAIVGGVVVAAAQVIASTGFSFGRDGWKTILAAALGYLAVFFTPNKGAK